MGNKCFISSDERELRRKNEEIDRQIEQDRKTLKKEYKILLLGEGESGKSTIVKQMKNIYMSGWTSDELLKYRPNIISNIVQSAQAIVTAMRDLGIKYQNDELLPLTEKILEHPYEVFEESMYTSAYAEILVTLWKDEGVQQCVERSREFYLLDSAPYYFEHAVRLAGPNYVPTVQDVLCARVKTTGITETRFSMGQLNIHMFDVGGQRSERKKWIHCFENVGSIIFCVALSGYDMVLLEDSRQNRLVESLLLFESIVNSKWFVQTSIVLLLNKTDIFQKKIPKVPLSKYFPEYSGGPDFKRAAEFILRRFAELNRAKLAIYPHLTCATDESNIRVVFAAVKETILQNSLKQAGLL